MRGKAPTPTHLAIVDKSNACRHNQQPEPSKDYPVPPEHLSDKAKEIFNRMVKRIEVLYPPSSSHTEMLAAYAEAEELVDHLDYLLRVERGGQLTYEGNNGIIRAYPEVAMLNDARKRCIDILREFGLSPSSQRCVKVEKKKAESNPFAEMQKKKANE